MPVLGYWKIRGLAQPIRLMLGYADVEFEDKMYEQGDGPEFSRDAWLKEKFTLGKLMYQIRLGKKRLPNLENYEML